MKTQLHPDSPAVVFVSGYKGGPGKSTFSRGLIDYYRSRNVVTAAYDGDFDNESLIQYYGQRDMNNRLLEDQDPLKGVQLFAARKPDHRPLLLNVAESNAKRIVIDLPGGGIDDVAQVLDSTDRFFEVFEEHGIRPIVVLVLSHIKASAINIPRTLETLGSRPHYVAVKNLSFGQQFPYFDGIMIGGQQRYGNAKKKLAELNADFISMPRLDFETYLCLDEFNYSFSEGSISQELTLTNREHIKLWRRSFATALEGTALAAPAVVPA